MPAPRTLVVLGSDAFVRSMVASGALDELDDERTLYVLDERVADRSTVEGKPGYLGTVPPTPKRAVHYLRLRELLMFAQRSRSTTMLAKTKVERPIRRTLRLGSRTVELRADARPVWKLLALPGLREAFVRWSLRQAGLNGPLHALIARERPDVVLVPAWGGEDLAMDAVRSARALGIPSLMVAINWDNLSSKGAFPVRPDHLAVWGEQSREHAVRIHGFDPDQVAVVGVPTFDDYFRHEFGSTSSPFPYRYVLFAGCLSRFDELTPLRRLEAAIEEHGLDLKVVYRPHPYRLPRERPDAVRESEFRHVVIDPQVRDVYLQTTGGDGPGRRAAPIFPALDYYPSLLENAEFVVCPLSTMMVEAAIFEKEVLAIAYDDGVHWDSPATVATYEHVQGMDDIEGFRIARRLDDLAPLFLELAGEHERPARPMREQIRWWLHSDESTYAQRLAALVARIAGGSAPGAGEPRERGEPLRSPGV